MPTSSRRRGSGSSGLYGRIYELVSMIPAGSVATYGQIAAIVGGCTPRMVGYAMASLPAGRDVPWHRVINSRGEISFGPGTEGREVQQGLLESEGVVFDESGRTDLSRFGWVGPGLRRSPGRKRSD